MCNENIKTTLGLILFLTLSTLSNGQRIRDKMYEEINGVAACFRRLNGTHQFGCSSSRGGSTGVIHFVESSNDLDVILNITNNLEYIPVLPVSLLKNQIINALEDSLKVSGIVLYDDNKTLEHFSRDDTTLEHFSHDDTCPNSLSNLDGTCNTKWNEYGTGLQFKNFKFPMFYIDNFEDIKKLNDCFIKFNNYSFSEQGSRPLCALQLDSFNYATKNSETCMARNQLGKLHLDGYHSHHCDPLGSSNIWGSLFPVGNSTGFSFGNVSVSETKLKVNMKYIVLATRMDTTSMFDNLAPGAMNPISGMVSLLSTAQILKKMLPKYENYGTNVLFILFNGETYDYIGSQRLVYDMQSNVFPVEHFVNNNESIPNIKFEDIKLYIEFNQISSQDGNVFVHMLQNTSELNGFVKKMSSNLGTPPIVLQTSVGIVPPSSLQTFLKARNQKFNGLVLSNHNRTYTNRFYNSIYDGARNLNYTYMNLSADAPLPKDDTSVQKFIGDLSLMVAKSVFQEITGAKVDELPDIKPDIRIIDELFYCYLKSANCSIHRVVAYKQQFADAPFNLYVGVTRSTNILSHLVGFTLAWLIGDEILTNGAGCYDNMTSYVFNYFNMSKDIDDLNTTVCIRSSMNFTDAVSPAFIIEDYDFKSGKYSSWTESAWSNFNVMMFLQPSRAHEIVTLCSGLSVFIIFSIVTWFINSKSAIIFEQNQVSPANC